MVDKPLMQYAVEEAYAAGVREMIFVTSRHKRAIEDHFDRTFELEDALEKASKAELLAALRAGQARRHGVRLRAPGAGARPRPRRFCAAATLVGDHPFAVLLPDDLMIGTPPVLAQMVEQFAARAGVDRRRAGGAGGADASLRHRRRPRRRRAAGRDRRGSSRSPRPRLRRRASASPAAILLTPRVFDEIDRQPRGVGGEIQLTDGIAGLLRAREGVRLSLPGQALRLRQQGRIPAGQRRARARRSTQLGADFRAFLKSLSL